MKILYLSYDGMTDSLGQSQVLPYLLRLAEKGIAYTIISFEKEENFVANKTTIENLLKGTCIKWNPLRYTKRPPVLSTIFDVWKLKKAVKKELQQGKVDIIHCRSYISALAGLSFKRKNNIPFIFDMRGFYADERLDGEIWSLKNPVFKLVYNFFKKKEKEFLTESEAVVSLTACGKQVIESWKLSNQSPISVIPCCTDETHFDPAKVDLERVKSLKNELGILEKDYVISYLGSIGTWYMLDEMLDFIKVLFTKKENSKALFITREPKEMVLSEAKKRGLDTSRIIIQSANREEVPTMVSLSDVSLFFIKPVFSKKASSPTKMGEILNLNIPIVCNSDVGDDDLVMNEILPQYLVKDFSNEEYERVIGKLLENQNNPNTELRKYASDFFSLNKGVETYYSIFKRISTIKNG
jgi:glycosyltransferase involved in cell wall biosynthesis